MTAKQHYLVLEIKPNPDQSAKPQELIQVKGHQDLTLTARRAITVLWHNAHLQGIEPTKDYTIALEDLRPPHSHNNLVVEDAVEALMKTILMVTNTDGSVTRVQFLGGNDMHDRSRRTGVLTYSFDRRLIQILKDSRIWGQISLPVIMALTSKYGVSLYEQVAQWNGLSHKNKQVITVEDLRDILGIEAGKYQAFGGLNKHVIQPALLEINALAEFNLSILPIKTGRKVTHVQMGWWKKTVEERKEAWDELHRPKVGRKARLKREVEQLASFTNAPGSFPKTL